MKKLLAASLVATLISSQAFAMLQIAPDAVTLQKGYCESVEDSDVLDIITNAKADVDVKIQLQEIYAGGKTKSVPGTPNLIYAKDQQTFNYASSSGTEANLVFLTQNPDGRFTVPKGFFRVIPKELQTVDMPKGVLSYKVVIQVCAP